MKTLVIVASWLMLPSQIVNQTPTMTRSDFDRRLEAGQIEQVTIMVDAIEGIRSATPDDKPGANMTFRVEWPNVVREQILWTRLQKYVPGKYKYDPFMLRTCTANKSCSLAAINVMSVVPSSPANKLMPYNITPAIPAPYTTYFKAASLEMRRPLRKPTMT